MGLPAFLAVTAAAVTAAVRAASAVLSAMGLGVGCNAGVRGKIPLAVYFAVADPYLDAEDSYLGVGFSEGIVDIGAECVERRTAFLEHFAPCHFSSAETAADLNLDTLCAYPHGGGYSHLDGPSV